MGREEAGEGGDEVDATRILHLGGEELRVRRGIDEAGRLLSAAAERGLGADILQSLAYRLYSLAEKHGWTEAGLLFNALGGSWPEIAAAARTAASTGPDIQTALDLDTLENH